jgi:predicted glycoside hydrolase/deacetylase ChbG (UPF0249 family)
MKKMDRRLIVTADDYGLCEPVNRAIESCIGAGAVSATCVMTNMPVYKDTIQLRERFPNASIGIHWTLTEGFPVLDASEIPSLVDENGMFYKKARLHRKWFSNQVNRSELKAELSAQFDRLRAMIGLPDFWNTHQDTHMVPGLFEACVSIGLELGIPAMRSHRRFLVFRDIDPAQYYLRHPVFWIKGLIIDRWSHRAEAKGMHMPDGKVYINGYGLNRDGIEEAIGRLPWNSVSQAAELVVHPTVEIDENVMHSLKEVRIREYEVFSDRGLVEGLRKQGVQITGFGGLEND